MHAEKKRAELLKAIQEVHTLHRLNFSHSAIGTAKKKLNEIRAELNKIDFPILSKAIFQKGK